MNKQHEPAPPALLVLQRTQRSTNDIVSAAKAFANTRCQLEAKLRKTLAGANYLQERTILSGARQALLAPELSAAMYKAAPSPELCLALGLATDTTDAYDFAVIQVTKLGRIAIIDAFQDAPGLCLTLLAEKACAHAQRHLARSFSGRLLRIRWL